MRAAVAAESAGIPSVSIVCEGFEGQASATGRGHGFDDMALAVTVGHVDAQSAEVMIDNFLTHTVDLVVAGLIGGETTLADTDHGAAGEPAALDVVARGTLDEINQLFLKRGWSDGLPIIPPTRERVEAYLAVTGHDPWKVLGRAVSSGRDLTVWSIAVNAVMTGCDPAHLPVLLAAAEILVDPRYGAEHSGNTTGADALMILNGPAASELGFNSGPGAMREGAHANTSVGRWLRLYLRNVFDFTADQHDKATFGNSTRVVLTEDHDTLVDIGWEPLCAQIDTGLGIDTNALTMARFNSGAIIGSVFGSTPDEITPYLGNGLARVSGWDLTHVHGLGHDQYQPLLVLSPILARTYATAGWNKADVQRALFEHARIPAALFERLIGEWSNLTAGRPRLIDLVADGHLPDVFAASDDPNRLVPIVTCPERIMIAVAGDPNRTNAYTLANDGPHGWWTTKAIDLDPSLDLVCAVDLSGSGGSQRPPTQTAS
ncbi:MAG: hypothetical protein OEW83_17010, partial [Acidimicrobiia bacterium]|nr:hypothetical protein [Acidimicrobiia bacterium]